MSSKEIAVRVANLSKCYEIYGRPQDRLKQSIYPRLRRLARQPPKQYYREFWALKDISFEIMKGETIGIIGRNGSGKSTLLQIICGTLAPTSGTVETNGRVAALLELGSGFNPEFTGRENVFMNGAVLRLTREEITARFDKIVAFADVGDFIEQPVKTYSSGMLLRLAFAVIAHVDADILVIDEALAVGDAFFTQKCMRFLRRFMETGTVLFVSHDTASVMNLCKFAIWIEKGEILQQGSPKEICEVYLQGYYEAQQGRSTSTRLRKMKSPDKPSPRLKETKDQRLEFINESNLRNNLEIFKFDQTAASFGKAGALITNVTLNGKDGAQMTWAVGGEMVTLTITAHAKQELHSPIIGFFIKDRLGQTLIGDNTYLSYSTNPVHVRAEGTLSASFTFKMPVLPKGDYSVCAAIADGTPQDHVQHHWIFDAVILKSESSSITGALIGIPMEDIQLTAEHENDYK